MESIVWAIRGQETGYNNTNVMIINASDRESAKRQARQFLFGNPDQFVCEPITKPGDIVLVHMTIAA